MRLVKMLALSTALTMAVACGSDDNDDDNGQGTPDANTGTIDAATPDAASAGNFSLMVELNMYGNAHGQPGHIGYYALWDDADNSAAVATLDQAFVSGGGGGGGGGNRVEFLDTLEAGKSYTLYWYADVNGNASCEDPDHHWSLAVPNVSADVMTMHQHTTTFNGDCGRH